MGINGETSGSIIRSIAEIIKEKGVDAAIVGEGCTSRYILRNASDEDYGLRQVLTLNLDQDKRLSRWDVFFLTASGKCYLVSPFEWEGVREEEGIISIRFPRGESSLGKILAELGQEHGVKTCGFSPFELNAKVYLDIAENAGFELKDLDYDPFELPRRKHTPREIEKIAGAQRIAEKALELLLPKIVPGAIECELRQELVGNMIRLGALKESCGLLGSGKATGDVHARATDKRIEKGDFVVMDFGAVFNDYCSDMTRTVLVGPGTDEQKFHYNLVLEAQEAAIDAFRPGAVAKDVHAAAVKVFEREGLAEYFTHGVGHNVGIDIHELPFCGATDEDVMETGYAMTIEPGLYFKGKYGIRIEDMIFLGPDGKVNLTEAPKELIIL
ncbi:MAG: M24 family metallopeptidase [Clostridiales Family XIII bacterium]|jgi:Xaa-Pro aminopeptidase|nr:M24 family metallopeptidase [Clostridiales Family XIII bacterium]